MTNNATSATTNIVLRAGTVTNGTQHRIELLNNVYLSDGLINLENNTVEISNYSLPKAKLYIYDACLTASNDDGTGHNLCTETISSGVDCVIGWTKPIDSVDAFSWQFRFQNKLVEGMSVKSAADYANTFSYWDNSSIKSWIIYGNQDIVVSQNEEITSSTMSTTGNSSLKHTAIQYTNYDINILKSILENEFSDFSSNDADITITYTNQKNKLCY